MKCLRLWFSLFAAFSAFVLHGAAADSASTLDRPSSPGAFRAFVAPQTVHADEVTLLWDKPDGLRVSEYEVFCDGRAVGKTEKTHLTVKGLQPERAYSLRVVAAAAEGTSGLSSEAVPVTTAARGDVVSVESFGAKGDGTTVNTKAIQAAIDACPANGTVLIPAGVFVSGALFLKSDMTLFIAEGGVLKGSKASADYEPFIRNRFEGWELDTYASLLNAGKLDHAAGPSVRHLSIRGQGTISGGDEVLAQGMIAAHGLRSRGRLICLMNCADVEIQGLTLEASPCWTLHYIYSENVSCHDLTIRSTVRNGDGLDPDSSRNSYVFNCEFSNGDDCIAIKSGKNPEGNVVDRPTENVRISDCRFLVGHGISIGSEMSGGVRDVLVEDCVAGNLLNGLQIKGTKDRGNVVERVTVRDCDLQKITVLTALNYNNDGQPAPEEPWFRDFHFRNIDLRGAKAGSTVVIVNGFSQPGHRTKNVTFDGLKLPAAATIRIDQAEDVAFSGVQTADGKPAKFEITRSARVSY